MTDEDHRFGMPDEAFRRAAESHGRDNPMIRWGSYVPTRGEVRTMAPDALLLILDGWIWESPTELIPNRDQIVEVRAVLAARPDASDPEVKEIIELCDDYLHPSSENEVG